MALLLYHNGSSLDGHLLFFDLANDGEIIGLVKNAYHLGGIQWVSESQVQF